MDDLKTISNNPTAGKKQMISMNTHRGCIQIKTSLETKTVDVDFVVGSMRTTIATIRYDKLDHFPYEEITTSLALDGHNPYGSTSFTHKNLFGSDLDYAKHLILEYWDREFGKGDGSDKEILDESEDLSCVEVGSAPVEGTNEELVIEAEVDLEKSEFRKRICIPALKTSVIVYRSCYNSLDSFNSGFLYNMKFEDLIPIEDREWDRFLESPECRAWLQEKFPVGSLIRFDRTTIGRGVLKDVLGTVTGINERGHICVSCDDGKVSPLIYAVDTFCIVENKSSADSKIVPVYRKPWNYAECFGEQDQYRISMRLNVECLVAVEKALIDHYNSNTYVLDTQAALIELIGAYGLERVRYVLAHAVRARFREGRISRENKDWAFSENISADSYGKECNRLMADERLHPGLLNLLVTKLRTTCG